MKRTFKTLATIIVCSMIASCATISTPVTATTNPVGSKCGVAESKIYLGLWSSNGEQNGIDQAAKSAGITKISHVDSYTKNYFFGVLLSKSLRFTVSNQF